MSCCWKRGRNTNLNLEWILRSMNSPPSPACINLCVGTNRTNSPPSPACTNLFSPTVRSNKQRLRDGKPDRRSNLTIVSGVGLSSILPDLPGWPHFVSFQPLSTTVALSINGGSFLRLLSRGEGDQAQSN